jgi:hypothetical protein
LPQPVAQPLGQPKRLPLLALRHGPYPILLAGIVPGNSGELLTFWQRQSERTHLQGAMRLDLVGVLRDLLGMGLITRANARRMAAKSHDARRQRRLAREYPHASPQPIPQLTDYVSLRLTRVRKQLDKVDGMMMKEKDPQKLDRLASAQTRLAEQERIMSGRPLPGSRRPGKEKPRREPQEFVPVDALPSPAREPLAEFIAPEE